MLILEAEELQGMLQGFDRHLGILVEWLEEVVLQVCARNTLGLELQFHLKYDFI